MVNLTNPMYTTHGQLDKPHVPTHGQLDKPHVPTYLPIPKLKFDHGWTMGCGVWEC
jgi:hypothetical protein